MFKKYFTLILFVIFISFIGFIVYRYVVAEKKQELPLIAITQIIEHNTLDTVREGLIKRLKEKGFENGKNIRIDYQNAHGQLTTAAQIVQRFASSKPKVIVALSTQSAQLLQNLSNQQRIPLIFTAVTDPVAAKLVKSFEETSKGLIGISDYMPPAPQIEMIRKFVPHIKRLGVLYNPSEVNSTVYLEAFEKEAAAQGITLVRSPLNNTSEAVSATRKLMGNVDAIYFPNDNTAMAAVSAIVSVAHTKNADSIPVFANDSASVEKGALAALAYDRTQMGYDTADMVMDALKEGFEIQKPVKVGSAIQTAVNKEALNKLNLSLPEALSSALMIEGK